MERYRTAPDDLVMIARNASLYDWLMAVGRTTADPLPRSLHADFGLPSPPAEPLWRDWHRAGKPMARD